MLCQHTRDRPPAYRVLQCSACFGAFSDTVDLVQGPVILFFLFSNRRTNSELFALVTEVQAIESWSYAYKKSRLSLCSGTVLPGQAQTLPLGLFPVLQNDDHLFDLGARCGVRHMGHLWQKEKVWKGL